MACEATTRLYDVDEDSVVFKRLEETGDYDQGTITFRARSGKRIDLDKLHESIWATRLSGGTRSGLIRLDVSAVGQVVKTENGLTLDVSNSNSRFLLRQHTEKAHQGAIAKLKDAAESGNTIKVTGQIANYSGRWPDVLAKRPVKPRTILVTRFEILEQP